MTLTNKGLVLQGKAQAGGKLNYTRIAVGDGSLTGQAVPAMNGLISQKINLPITRITTQPPNKAIIGSVLRNADVSTGFYWREVGVFAQDPDAGEILYAYANAGVTADYIPPGGGSDIIEKTFDCVVVVGTAANITAVIDESLVFAKKTELDAVDAAKVDKVSGKGLSANDYTTAEKNKLAGITAGAGGAGSATDTVIGSRTISDTTAPTGDSGTVTNLLGWLANTVKSITGKSSWRTAPATTLEAAKAHADDATRHLNAADRAAISGAIPSSQRNIANGVAALDNASLIVGQGVRLGGSEQYMEKVFSFQTVNGTVNQKIDYSFGPAVMSGFIEVTVTGAWGNASSEGRLTKRMDVMGSTAGTINRQSSQYTEVSGAIRGLLSISDVYWKDGKWTVTVEARTSAGNNYTTHIKHHGPLGAKDWMQGSIYTGAATTLPLAVQVIPDDTKTKSGQQVETTVGAQAKADAAQAAAIAYTDTKIGRVDLTQTLGPGTSVVTADANGSELDLVVQGRTLVNLLGKLGNAESLDGWSKSGTTPALSSTQKRSGASSFKFSTLSTGSYIAKVFPALDTSKAYILGVWAYIESFTQVNGGALTITIRDADGNNIRYGAAANTSLTGQWQFLQAKIPIGHTVLGSGFTLLAGLVGSSNAVAYMDDIRLYEISAAEYAAIGTTIASEQIDAYWPYVDCKQHVQGVAISKQGLNLLPLFLPANFTTNNVAVIFNGDNVVIPAAQGAGTFIMASDDIAAQPVAYTLSADPGQSYRFIVRLLDASGAIITTAAGMQGFTYNSYYQGFLKIAETVTFTPPEQTKAMRIGFGSFASDIGGVTSIVSKAQLEFGSAVTPFTPVEPQSVILPVMLGQIGDVRDSVYSAGGEWMYLERVRKSMVLDGARGWVWGSNSTGYKTAILYLADIPGAIPSSAAFKGIKYDGSLMVSVSVSGQKAADQVGTGTAGMALTIANSDSGWGDAYTPSVAEIKAYFNGYRMNNGTFGTPYNGSGTKTWTLITAASNAGAVTTVPTTQSPITTSWQPYTLDYVLAQAAAPVPVPNAEGSITLHPGGNQISVETGAIQSEKANPKVHSDGNCYINNIAVGSSTYLSQKTNKILAVYKGADIDTKWTLLSNHGSGYGGGQAYIATGNFDANASYYVTYIALDKYVLTANVTETAATWRTGLGGVVSDVVQSVAELRQDNDQQDFADDYIEAKVDNLKLDIVDGSALPDTIQKHQLTGNSGLGKGGNPTVSPNTLLDTGIYTLTFSSPDLPVSGSTTTVFVKRYNSAYIIQEADVFATVNTITVIRKFTRESRNSGSSWSTWRELKMKASPLANNTDLNTLVYEGQFYAVSNASAATITNQPPVGGNYCFNLDVKTTVSADGTGCNQTITYYSTSASSPTIFTRNFYQTIWTNWQQIETAAVKNVAGGYAGLDSSGDIALTVIPDVVQKYSITKDDGKAIQLSGGTDLNTVLTIGFYTINNPGNSPITSLWVHLLVQTHSGASDGTNYVVQRVMNLNETGTPPEWIRRRVNGTWTSWVSVPNSSLYNVANGIAGLTSSAVLPDNIIPQSITRRVPLTNQLQKSSYYRSVIALCELTNTNPSYNSYSNGLLTMHRGNGLSGQVTALVNAEKRYNTTTMNYSAFRIGATVQVFRPCTFTYNGVKYGGIDLYITDAEFSFVEFNGATNFGIFAVDYYNNQTSTKLNSEIFDSLNTTTDYTYVNDISLNGSGLNAERVAGKTLAEVVQGSLSFAVTTGTATALVASISPAPVALTAGLRVTIKTHVATSGPITLNVNGLGAKSIKKPNGNNPPLVQGGVYTVVYDGTAFILQGEGGEYGTATASHVLSGYSIGTENGVVNGEISNNGPGGTITPNANVQTKPAGFYSSAISISGVAVPVDKVLNGTTIAGSLGTMPNRSAENNNMPPQETAYWPVGAYNNPYAKVHFRPPAGYYNGSTWISADSADMLPENVLAGKSIFGMKGNIPNRTNDQQAVTSWTNGAGALSLGFPTGAYLTSSGFGAGIASVAITNGNFTSGNIRSGVNIFGVVGNLKPISSASGIIWAGGSITISGLGFRPKVFSFSYNPNGESWTNIWGYFIDSSILASPYSREILSVYDSGGSISANVTILDNGITISNSYNQIATQNYLWSAWG
nr:phage tail protein [Paenibacillus silagei]